VSDCREIHVEVSYGNIIRIPLMTKLGSLEELNSLAVEVGIEQPTVTVINLSVEDITRAVNHLISQGIIDNKIRRKVIEKY
jgi:hypothetical protein